MKVIIVGGVAGGASCAARLRRILRTGSISTNMMRFTALIPNWHKKP